ncbi:olfactory receptor 11A1-like [Silurus asotus]|uniref:Olfactory receptor 11A1-like n=1 Tax=Silurus asotus TaxID=30991 RepID=A0AAD5B0S1_SILAS|nr:olfactory receptor 11A1-like [Silurus asotus]
MFFAVSFIFYLQMYLEAKLPVGVLNRRNRAGCRTIAFHGVQLAVYILPNFINFLLFILKTKDKITTDTKELFGIITFVFFSLAQCIAPIVYGLRKEEMLEQLNLRFPWLACKLKSLLERTVGHQPHQRLVASVYNSN